jgi:hypothetical protein
MYNPNKYNYVPMSRVEIDGKRKYATPDGEKLPSVTTILDATKPEEAKKALNEWLSNYSINEEKPIKNIGIVMAGNIPMVGFHDFLCVFLAGHRQTIQFSSKDNILLPFLIETIKSWHTQVGD